MEIQMKILSAVFYGFVSLFITLGLKAILTIYKFPSVFFIGICQIFSIIIMSFSMKICKRSRLSLKKQFLYKVFPLPIFYIIDLLMGLGGTMELNLPMFTVLRRISNVMLLFAEIFCLKAKYNVTSIISVFLMVLGSIVAALNDLSYSSIGYTFVMINNISTAMGGIYLKLKQNELVMNDLEIVFYNSLIALCPLMMLIFYNAELQKVSEFEHWQNISFLCYFVGVCFLGALLRYSMVSCTMYNGPLTTSVIGVTKNIAVTYVGMYFGGDYIFDWFNFIGLNISMLGAVLFILKKLHIFGSNSYVQGLFKV